MDDDPYGIREKIRRELELSPEYIEEQARRQLEFNMKLERIVFRLMLLFVAAMIAGIIWYLAK